MTDENKQETVDEEVVDGDTTDTEQEQKPKFTAKQQEELNRLLAAERKSVESKSKRALEKAQSEWQATETSLRSQITEFESGLEAVIKVQTAEFDPIVLRLLAGKPILEQWRELQDPEFVEAARKKNTTPITPRSEGKHESKPVKVVPFGGR